MSRKPVYHANNEGVRVISGPNGSWLVQKRALEKGTKDADCWDTEYSCDTFNEARKVLL